MLKFLLWMFRFTGASLLFVVSFIAFLEEDSEPAYERFTDWEDDDGIGSRNGATIGRTAVGSIEPVMASTRGELIGLMSGVRIKS